MVGTPAFLGMPVPWDNYQGQQHVYSGADLRLQDKLCVLGMTKVDLLKPFDA